MEAMTEQERAFASQCVEKIASVFQWVEALSAWFDGPVLHFQVEHSYPVDIRRELRRELRALAPNMPIELSVSMVPPGYGVACKVAEDTAQAAATGNLCRCPDCAKFWN